MTNNSRTFLFPLPEVTALVGGVNVLRKRPQEAGFVNAGLRVQPEGVGIRRADLFEGKLRRSDLRARKGIAARLSVKGTPGTAAEAIA